MQKVIAGFSSLVVLLALDYFAVSVAHTSDVYQGQPSSAPALKLSQVWKQRVCPVANCVPENLVWAKSVIQSKTVKDAAISEWLAVDGLYVNTGQPNGQKVARYIGVVQGPKGGSSWALNTDIVRNGIPSGSGDAVGSSKPGSSNSMPDEDSSIGYELDFTNWDKDASPGVGPFTVGMYIHNQSTHTSLAGIYFDAAPQSRSQEGTKTAWDNGILFNTSQLVKDNTLLDATTSSYSLHVEGSHMAGFYDNSNSNAGIHLGGKHTDEDIWVSDDAPTVLRISGYHEAVLDGTSPHTHIAYILNAADNQKVCFSSHNACFYHNATTKKLYYQVGGRLLFSVSDQTGDATFIGKVVQNGQP